MQRVFLVIASALVALLLAGPAVAKDGFEARLDRALPAQPSAGSTVHVGWTLIDPRSDGVLEGVSTFLRIHPLGGPPVEVVGREGAAGHYTASFVAPAGGIVRVEIGMLGEMCENGQCTRSDVMFPIDEPDGAKSAPGAAFAPAADRQAPAAAGASLTPTTPGKSRPASIDSAATLLALVMLAGASVAGIAFAARRVVRRA